MKLLSAALVTAAGLLARHCAASPLPGASGAGQPLQFKSDGTFQISIFEDLHFGENAWNQWGPQQDINSVKTMNKILDAEPLRPGLVVLNGDLITGENVFVHNGTDYVDQIVGPLVRRDLSWASTYGNHDSDYNISRESILAREQRWPNSRTAQMVHGPNAGVSNYYLPVYAADADVSTAAPELILWFFDSRGGYLFQQKDSQGNRVGQPNWVDVSVVEWFRQTSAALAEQHSSSTSSYHGGGGTAGRRRAIPSLAFVHIPTNATVAVQAAGRVDDRRRNPGINDDVPLAGQAQAWCPDGRNGGGTSCPYGGQDVPFMEALATTPGLMAIFSGHDHGDTWCYRWDGRIPGRDAVPGGAGSDARNSLDICFGQHSGYGGYGTWTRGARQLRLSLVKLRSASPELDTWIRLESGDAVGAVTLNATYGTDVYAPTPNTHTRCPTCDYTYISSSRRSILTPILHPRQGLLSGLFGFWRR